MHLTGGQFKGRKIETAKCTRPTLSIVRESVFNSLFSYFGETKGLIFLDLFSGSGLISLEAVSRGYSALSIELNPANARIIKENFKSLGLLPNLIVSDCIKFLGQNNKKFDVIYIDPPWCDENFKYTYDEILKQAFLNIKEGGIIVFESEKIKKLSQQKLSPIFEEKLIREKVHGRCLLNFFKG